VPIKVVDTVGAGDAFTAAMTLGLLAGWHLDAVNSRANQVAAYVASCAGATPPLPPELRAIFSGQTCPPTKALGHDPSGSAQLPV
jgi:fructokinase